MPVRKLVLISGPIASGKTSLAENLAHIARRGSLKSASIDVDLLVEMVAGEWPAVTPTDLQLARHLAAILINELFDLETNLIAVAGTTLAKDEWDDVLRALTVPPNTYTVLLKVTLEESVRRAQADPGRVLTKDANFVARIYAEIDWSAVRRCDVEIDTDSRTALEVAALVGQAVSIPNEN